MLKNVANYNELEGGLKYLDCPNCKNKGYGVPGTLKVESGTMALTDGKAVQGYWYTYTENGYTFRSFVSGDN